MTHCKKTAAELQLEGKTMRLRGEAVCYIRPWQVDRWTEHQLPHIVTEDMPHVLGESEKKEG